MKTTNFTREELAQYILNTAKETVIDKIKSVISNEAQEDIIAYTTKGKPLNTIQYKAEIQKGIDDIKAGKTITDDDLTNAIENW